MQEENDLEQQRQERLRLREERRKQREEEERQHLEQLEERRRRREEMRNQMGASLTLNTKTSNSGSSSSSEKPLSMSATAISTSSNTETIVSSLSSSLSDISIDVSRGRTKAKENETNSTTESTKKKGQQKISNESVQLKEGVSGSEGQSQTELREQIQSSGDKTERAKLQTALLELQELGKQNERDFMKRESFANLQSLVSNMGLSSSTARILAEATPSPTEAAVTVKTDTKLQKKSNFRTLIGGSNLSDKEQKKDKEKKKSDSKKEKESAKDKQKEKAKDDPDKKKTNLALFDKLKMGKKKKSQDKDDKSLNQASEGTNTCKHFALCSLWFLHL